ncbi:hypothetical protein [Salinarimonas soli]|uniref:Uncharacterized protein n=1 Tax=Salinarimonas soli TaxID=1638099 RepID=A0A5B2VS29_9HYPH|nr:hypothetical protein [Salinarimonas soli]KAA2241052.1 hypothetical protein F0L46_05290 [Salinarimonas soli]
MVRTDQTAAEFVRLHKAFILHFGAATVLAWATALYAGFHAPWVRNLAFLIDPSSYKVESTWSYLFGFPLLMTVAWVAVLLARDMLFATRLRGHLVAEFAVAGAVGFLMFYLAIDRAVAALRLAF